MRIVIYDTVLLPDRSSTTRKVREVIPVDSLSEARAKLNELYVVEVECAEWNVAGSTISSSLLEAHVWGLCRDERVDLFLEDDGKLEGIDEDWTYDDTVVC